VTERTKKIGERESPDNAQREKGAREELWERGATDEQKGDKKARRVGNGEKTPGMKSRASQVVNLQEGLLLYQGRLKR